MFHDRSEREGRSSSNLQPKNQLEKLIRRKKSDLRKMDISRKFREESSKEKK